MFSIITSLFKTTLAKNLINHYTGGGIIIGVLALVQANIIPSSAIDLTTGMNTKQVLPWLIFAVAIWVISHLHIITALKWFLSRKINKASQQLELDKLKLEDVKIQQNIDRLKQAKGK